MARELFGTPWIKLEVIGDHDTLQPDPFGLVEAARILCAEGFEVFPYTTEDLIVAERLLDAGCQVLMPWGAPIGSGSGLEQPVSPCAACARISPTCRWWSMPGSACPRTPPRRWNSATTRSCSTRPSRRPATRPHGGMRSAMAVEAGRAGFEADPMEPRDMAAPSTPVLGTAFRA